MCCIDRAPWVWSGMWDRNWWRPCEKWLFYLLRFSNETWCRPNRFCGWFLIRPPSTHVWTVTIIVEALPLCCHLGLASVGNVSKTEPQQLQNCDIVAFIFAHNCVGDWCQFDDAYARPGRTLRRRWSNDVVESALLSWRGGGNSVDGDSSWHQWGGHNWWCSCAQRCTLNATAPLFATPQANKCARYGTPKGCPRAARRSTTNKSNEETM